MKFSRQSKLKFSFGDFFHITVSELEKLWLWFSRFNAVAPSLPKQQTTVNRFWVLTLYLAAKLNHLWAYINAKHF